MKKTYLSSILVIVMLLGSYLGVSADETLPKHTLKSNSQVLFHTLPESAQSLSEVLSKGIFYGRIRSNSFYLDYKKNDDSSDHFSSGLGGSLIYKSASFSHFDFTTGLYFSQAFFWDKEDEIENLKKAKDVLSRFDYTNDGRSYMAVLGQSYIRYTPIDGTHMMLGRQLVETFYTKSNDTKMIPNTFDGLVISTNIIPKTRTKLAYLQKQKLRDHTQSHSVLMYGDANSTSALNPQWSQNDDSAMHKGLTYTALKEAGKPTDAPLIVADFQNTSLHNIQVNASFYSVPELLSQAMLELNYATKVQNVRVSYGVRYIKQFDNGAGAVGGASYTGDSTGYKDPESLESQMIAARVVSKIGKYKINLGYTNILDEADLITPWRGFPTSGYTRSMARYNWRANTQSYRLEVVKNANDTALYKDMFIQASILYKNADESKGAKDEIYYYVGFVQNAANFQNLQWRLRLGYAHYLKAIDRDDSNLDSRFEIDYLF